MIGKIFTWVNIGTVLGTLPAGLIIRYFGLKKIVILTIALGSLLCGIRALHLHSSMDYAAAGLSGFCLGLLMVAATLAITQLTSESRRAWGFSVFFGASIGATVIGDAIGAEVHNWAIWFHEGTPEEEKQLALRLSGIISLFGVIPALFLKLAGGTKSEPIVLPRNQVVLKLFSAIAIWNFAYGLFMPFYTVYFKEELAASMRKIGLDLTGGQVASAIAILAVPAMLKRYTARGILKGLMLGAALASFYLWLDPDPLGTGASFALLCGCIGMTQPLFVSLVMNNAKPEERTGAAIVSSLIGFTAAAASSYAGGWGISTRGYGEMLFSSGMSCVASAILFTMLIRPREIDLARQPAT